MHRKHKTTSEYLFQGHQNAPTEIPDKLKLSLGHSRENAANYDAGGLRLPALCHTVVTIGQDIFTAGYG